MSLFAGLSCALTGCLSSVLSGNPLASYWQGGSELYFNEGAYNASATPTRTLMTQAVAQALGWSNGQATTNPPMTVTLSDGTVGYAAHNLLPGASDLTGGWTVEGSLSRSVVAGPGNGFATATRITNLGAPSTAAIYRDLAVGVVNSRAVKLRKRGGSATSVSVSSATGASWRLVIDWTAVPADTWIDCYVGAPYCTLTNAGDSTSAGFYLFTTGGTADIEVAVCTVQYGSKFVGWVDTTSAAVYGLPISYDRGATHNLLQQSGDLSAGVWLTTSMTVVSGQGTPPSREPAFLVYPASSGTRELYQAYSYVAGADHALVVRAKAAGLRWLAVGTNALANRCCYFDLVNGVPGAQAAGYTSSMRYVGGGWYECVTLLPAAAARSAFFHFFIADSNGGTTVTANGTNGILLSAPQINYGLTALAYLRTFATAPLYTAGTPKAQNLFLTADLSSGSWTKSNSSVTAGQSDPFGGSAAFKIVENNATAQHLLNIFPSGLVAGCVYTYALYSKAAERSRIRIVDAQTNFSLTVDLSNGSPVSSTGERYAIQALSGGWYRIAFSWVASTAPNLAMYPLNGGASSYAGDGTSGVIVYLPQVYEGTADLGDTTTAGTAYSLYPQRCWLDDAAGSANAIRNSSMVGAAAGTPGTLPTNWSVSLAGLTQTVSTGTANGQPYVDIRLNGTTSGTAFTVAFDGTTQIAAANGQTWTASVAAALVAGSLTNVTTAQIRLFEYSSVPGYLVDSGSSLNLLPYLSTQTHTRTLNNASTAYCQTYLYFTCSSGVAIDLTIRVMLPQQEQRAVATAWIPTPSAAVTRAGTRLTPSAGFVTDGPQTVVWGGVAAKAANGSNQTMVARALGYCAYINGAGVASVYDGTAAATSGTAADGVPFTVASRWSGSAMAVSKDGATPGTAAFDGSMGSGTPGLGHNGAGGTPFTGEHWFVKTRGAIPANDAELQLISAGVL